MMFRFLALALFLAGVPAHLAFAQSATERHVWQDRQTFEPMSDTAQSITGAIMLGGNSEFGRKGSRMKMTFGNGPAIELMSEGASRRVWDVASDEKETAEVFRLDRDPGTLENGNTLCGDPQKEPARYLVFSEGQGVPGERYLNVAAFSSKEPPHDINSPGLCGTFTFSIN